MKKIIGCLSLLLAFSCILQSAPVTLRPAGGPLARLGGNQTISTLNSQAAVNSSLLWLNKLSALDPADVKYYRTFLTEYFSFKLSVLMGTAVTPSDETPTKTFVDPTTTRENGKLVTMPLALSNNAMLSCYVRSFNPQYNSAINVQGQALTPSDTLVGVIVNNGFSRLINFQPVINDDILDADGDGEIASLFPNVNPINPPDYIQTIGYDAAVFAAQGGVDFGQIGFIPMPDFTDSWYDRYTAPSSSLNPSSAIRSLWYNPVGIAADYYNSYYGLTMDGGANYGNMVGILVTNNPGAAPTIELALQTQNIGIQKKQVVVNSALTNFFSNDQNIQWAPVIEITQTGEDEGGNPFGSIDIIGLVKLNPYYFPLYYSGAGLQNSQLNQNFNLDYGPDPVMSYVNSATGVGYFSERRIFDSIMNLYTEAAAMPLMPEVGQVISSSAIAFPWVTNASDKNIIKATNSSTFAFDSNLSLNFTQTASGWTYVWSLSKATGSVNQQTNMNLQNFGLVKFAGLLEYDFIFNDPSAEKLTETTMQNPASYENLFLQSKSLLAKYYLLPGHISSATILQGILANPSNGTAVTFGGKTDIYIPATTTYIPAVAVTTALE